MNLLYFVSSMNFGGAEKQTVLDANLMSKEHDVFLLSFSKGPLNEIVSDQVNFITIERSGYIKNAYDLVEICKIEKIQIIHAALFAAFIISSITSFIYKELSVIWHFHSHEYDMPLKSKIVIRLCSRISGVKKLLFVNTELVEHFDSYGFPKGKQGVMYNHSTVETSEPVEKENLDTLVHIGYVGRVIELKRVHFLIDVAKALRNSGNHHFVIDIVGNGDKYSEIEELIHQNELTKFVKLHGFQTDVNKFYRGFDFFVNPSREECLSIAMIDAGIHSLPIVAFDVGGNNEIVVDGKTGFIVNDKQRLIESCLELTNDCQLRIEMGNRSRTHCIERFSEPVHKKELLDVYMDIVQ